MKPTELRIGNLVQTNFKKEKEITDIKLIDFKENFFRLYDPIQLTEEWLLKFGFEKTENGYFVKDGIILYPIRDLYFRGNLFIKADIKYVHQIQNLYFALIGEELTPKK